ncbi:MAG: M48 family metalloprotease [Deltaproteobacteria bacterium]|nr:M48 family metalloprotease [Deltaproteobacteria bacterium]
MKYFVIIIAVCCLAAGCITPHAVPLNEEFNSSEDERMLWRRAQKEQEALDNSGFLYRDPALENYLNRMAEKLQENSIAPDFQIHVKVLNDPNLNAFAYPNGVIYVHSGILARLDNEAQLAALLSHEMTHCTHRHSLRVIRSIKDRPAHIAAVQQTVAKIPAIQAVARLLGATGSMAAVTGYTQELENEADRVGLDLMVKANYDARQALKLFEHLKQEIEAEGIEEPYFFGTHPHVQQRLNNVKNWLAKDKEGIKAPVKNTSEFQTGLQGVVLANARLDLKLGRFDVARKTLGKYLDMRPNDARAYYLLGEILRQRNRKKDAGAAVIYYKKAISLDPTFAEPYKAMGLLHYKVGEKQLAKKFFESCLLLSPNASDKAYIQGYLKNCKLNGEES